MAVLLDAQVLAGQFDFSGESNALALEYGVDLQDGTTFGATTRKNDPGMKTVVANVEGLVDQSLTGSHQRHMTQVGALANEPVTISPTRADGEVAFLFRAIEGEYGPEAAIGEQYGYGATFEGADGSPFISGLILRPALKNEAGAFTNTATGSGTGTGRLLGAVAAGKKLAATLHVLKVAGTSGPTLTVTIQSDDNAGFTSPTTRLTFAAKGAAGAEWLELAGPVTDTYWRAIFTIGGTNPAFDFVVAIGIST